MENAPDWVCKICHKEFKLKHGLKQHIMRKHNLHFERDDYSDKVNNQIWSCDMCKKTFTLKNNLRKHQRQKHSLPKKVINKKVEDIKCTVCQSSFDNRTSLEEHKKVDHNMNDNSFKTTKCLYPSCQKRFYKKTEMIDHIDKVHDIKCEISAHNFASLEAFYKWKEEEEARQFVRFTKQRGTCVKDDNSTMVAFICQKDGSARSHIKKSTDTCDISLRTSSRDRVKSGLTCLARMLVNVPGVSGEVFVKYFKTHNHTILQVDGDSTNGRMKKEIRRKVLIKHIKKDLCDFLETVDVQSKNKNSILHPDDVATLRTLELKDESTVLIYKPYKRKVKIGNKSIDDLPNSKNLFMLGLQTKEELAVLRKYQVVFIGGVRNSDDYQHKLIKLVVPDELGRGYSAGHFLTNCEGEEILKLYFTSLKQRAPDLIISCIMSDNEMCGPNAMRSVFGANIPVLFVTLTS